MSLCTNSAFGKVRKFPNFQSAKVVKKLKSKKKKKKKNYQVHFLGLNFLHLPNVLIHEPNEFIHVRKLKPTLKIQILLVQKRFLFVLSVTRTRLITGSNLVPFWLELCYSDLV